MGKWIGNILFWLVCGLGWCLRLVPNPVKWAMATFLAGIRSVFVPSQVIHAMRNLRKVYPQKPLLSRWQIFVTSHVHSSLCALEWLSFPVMPRLEWSKRFSVQHPALLDLTRKHGGLLLFGHVGNWAYALAYYANQIGPIAVIGRSGSSTSLWKEHFLTRMWESQGVVYVPESRSHFHVVRYLHQKYGIAVFMDEFVSSHMFGSVEVEWLGSGVWADPLLAKLQMHTNQYVFPVVCFRNRRENTFQLLFDGKIRSEAYRLEEYQKHIYGMMKKYLSYVERWARAYCQQWEWNRMSSPSKTK